MKFKIVKRFSLDFLGEEWKEAYIDFDALTISDVKQKFPALATMESKTKEELLAGVDAILDILKAKFVGGKAIDDKGKLEDLQATDLEALPIEVLSKALAFLSQSATATS